MRGPTEKAEAGLMIRKHANISIFRPHIVFLSIFMHHEYFFSLQGSLFNIEEQKEFSSWCLKVPVPHQMPVLFMVPQLQTASHTMAASSAIFSSLSNVDFRWNHS